LNNPAEARVGQQIILSATLTDSNQKAVAGATIEYSAVSNGIEKQIGTAKTDQNGTALIPFTPVDKGNYLIKAKFSQNENYLASSDSTIVSAGLLSTSLAINAPSEGKVGDAILITATLTDANKQPINQADVQFQVLENGAWALLNSTATNSLGVASTEYNLDKAGTLMIKAMYAGTQEYGGSISTEITLGITEENLILNTLPYIAAIVVAAVAVSVSSAFLIRRRQRRV
jgi:5-hydroxyisourate hydrolase-like protein (transthyretin family)